MTSRLAEPFNPTIDHRWMLPDDLPGFLRVLAQTPALGSSDRARLTAFMRLQQAAWMPKTLRDAVSAYLSGGSGR
jgi:hypothetical protein